MKVWKNSEENEKKFLIMSKDDNLTVRKVKINIKVDVFNVIQ